MENCKHICINWRWTSITLVESRDSKHSPSCRDLYSYLDRDDSKSIHKIRLGFRSHQEDHHLASHQESDRFTSDFFASVVHSFQPSIFSDHFWNNGPLNNRSLQNSFCLHVNCHVMDWMLCKRAPQTYLVSHFFPYTYYYFVWLLMRRLFWLTFSKSHHGMAYLNKQCGKSWQKVSKVCYEASLSWFETLSWQATHMTGRHTY